MSEIQYLLVVKNNLNILGVDKLKIDVLY